MPAHKGGKKCRKHGTGKDKLARSRWGTYKALIDYQLRRRKESLLRRFCDFCKAQFHSRGVFIRHDCPKSG